MKTWRKREGHNGHTNKPGMIPVEEFKPRTLAQKRCLESFGVTKFCASPEARKEAKKIHNRKSRYYLNRDLVKQEMENC